MVSRPGGQVTTVERLAALVCEYLDAEFQAAGLEERRLQLKGAARAAWRKQIERRLQDARAALHQATGWTFDGYKARAHMLWLAARESK